MRWWFRTAAGVAVWQPYGVEGANGLDGTDDMWHGWKPGVVGSGGWSVAVEQYLMLGANETWCCSG